MKKLSNRRYILHKAAEFTGAAFLVVFLLFIWQLYRGSISLPFLKPYIISALNHEDTDYKVTLDEVSLELVRSIQPLRIIAKNVSYKKEGTISVNASKVALSFSIKALLRGIVAPSSIEVDKPKISIFSHYGVKDNKSTAEIKQKKLNFYFDKATDFWEHFNSEDNIYPESYINSIIITDANLELLEVDLGKKWVFSDVDYYFDRGFTTLKNEIKASMQLENSMATLGLSLDYNYKDSFSVIKFSFSDLIPANLINLINSTKSDNDFYNIQVPLSGQIETKLNLNNLHSHRDNILENSNKIIDEITFDFVGKDGKIKFSQDATYDYDISGLVLKGAINGDLEKVTINNAGLNMDNQKAEIGLDIKGLKDLIVNGSAKNLQIRLKAKVPELKTDKLSRFWPKYFGYKAWKWCKESLFGGKIKNGDFYFDFGYDNKQKSLVFKELYGIADIENGNIIYLNTMPKVTNIYGKATFSQEEILINLQKAKSNDVVVNGGYVSLYDLNKEDNFLKLELNGIGAITDILKLIDHEPLNYPSEMGLNPDNIRGTADAKLMLAFELRQDLSPKDVQVEVEANLRDIIMKDIIKDKVVEAKSLNLDLNNHNMTIAGVASISGTPLNFIWNENFEEKSYQRRYQISFSFDDEFKKKYNLNTELLNEPYIKGTIPTKAIVTVYPDDKTIIDVHGNLRETEINYGFLGFSKKSGINGEISAQINLEKNTYSLPSFTLQKSDFKLGGNITFNKKGKISSININNIKGPKTNAKAQIKMDYTSKEKITVIATGSSYDLSTFFNDNKDKEVPQDAEKNTKQTDDDIWSKTPNTDINIAVDKLWTGEDIFINNFAGSAKIINKKGIEEIHVVGNFKPSNKNSQKESYLKLDYSPRSNNEYFFRIDSNDAGATLKFLHFYKYMRGGSLTVEAKRGADKKIIGHAKARNFNLVKTNILAKLLSLTSFSGILDMLSGDGIVFTHFDAPFEYTSSNLILNDAKAFGNVIGLSLSGGYNVKSQAINFSGLIAPAYGLNTILGKIPLVGKLLSDSDGTVFAVNYDVKGNIASPIININPLSVLSPNSLKEFWRKNFGENDK